jgi:hypothetical protein
MGLHFEITSFEKKPHNVVDTYSDVHTFERYQFFLYLTERTEAQRVLFKKKLCASVTDNSNAWVTVTCYRLYPDLNLEEPEKQEKQRNSQCPLQNLLTEKFLQAAA